jgi:hypothetical protein
MKLPITFEQFKSDPSKGNCFFVGRCERNDYRADRRNQRHKRPKCEKRLQMCEAKLDKLTTIKNARFTL